MSNNEPRPNDDPDLIVCKLCDSSKLAKECWWCRDCAITLCSHCNLLKGHTQHRSVPWTRTELAESCVRSLYERCQARLNQAAEDEILVREYMSEVESYFLTKIQQQLHEQNEQDRAGIAALVSKYKIDDRKVRSAPHTPFSGRFKLLDSKVDRTWNEIKRIDPQQPSIPLPKQNSRVAKFAGLAISEIPVEDFAKLLEQKLKLPIRLPSERSEVHFDDSLDESKPGKVSFGEFKPSEVLSTSTPRPEPPRTPAEPNSPIPIEPKINIINSPLVASAPPENYAPAQNLAPKIQNASNITPMVSEDTQTNGVANLTHATQTDSSQGNSSSGLEKPMLEDTSFSSSTDSSSGATPSHRCRVTALNFGADFLTRPIDVCVLPFNRLAVSDSCGGVYVTNLEGDRVHHIWTDGGSASSLAYCQSRQELLVSLYQKNKRRVLLVYNSVNFSLRANPIECPEMPPVDSSRTRWVAVTRDGEIFMAAGDNKISAVWKYHRMDPGGWVLVEQSQESRYQGLTVIENHPTKGHLVVVTCEGVRGCILMLCLDEHHRLVCRYNVESHWNLKGIVHSPVTVVFDDLGNILVLDYSSGKVFLAQQQDKNTPQRFVSPIADIGPQGGVGLAADSRSGWCYVTCYAKQRVYAVKYLD